MGILPQEVPRKGFCRAELSFSSPHAEQFLFSLHPAASSPSPFNVENGSGCNFPNAVQCLQEHGKAGWMASLGLESIWDQGG